MSRPVEELSEWSSDVLTTDGAVVQLRPLTDADRDAVIDFYRALPEEDVKLRFFTSHLPSDDLMAPSFDPDRPVAITLAAEESGRLLAVAMCTDNAAGAVPEMAFAVAPEHQGRGIGTLLLEHLVAHARAHRVDRLRATTLPINRSMLGVFRRAGYQLATDRDIDGVKVTFLLDDGHNDAVDRREQQSEAESVRRVLCPTSVAVIGASRQEMTVGNALVRNLVAGGFAGPVFPVNPKAVSVAAVPAHPSVTAIGKPVDLAVIAVPAHAVPDALRDCGEAGVAGVVVVTAGFSEAGDEGTQSESDLVRVARDHGMRLVGPNCIGVVNTNPDVRLNATFSPVQPQRGNVSFASQSGALGIALLGEAASCGMGVASFVSLGNKADISSNDMLQYWQSDPETSVGVLYLESFGNPRKFARLASRFNREKPLVVVKSGRSGAGKRAASSHTAALASDDSVAAALFRQAGIIRVDTLSELFDVTRFLSAQPLPTGGRVAIVGNSGGPGILAADACVAKGLEVPPLADETSAALAALLPAGAGVANPVDLIASATAEQYETALDLVMADPHVDAVVVIYTDPMVSDAAEIVAAISRAASRHPRTPVVANFLAADVGATLGPTAESGHHAPIPVYDFPESAVNALHHAAGLSEWRRQASAPPTPPGDVDPEAARDIAQLALVEEPADGWLAPASVARLLEAFGVQLVPTTVVRSAGEAADAAAELGRPVALKVVSDSIVHKTDVGGVRLGLPDGRAAAEAYESMRARLGDAMAGAVVQPMVDDGVELIIGGFSDESFGPVVLVGAGGTEAELWADRALALAPVGKEAAHQLIASTKISRVLRGWRGSPPADIDAVADLLVRISSLMDQVPEVRELDLNPVIAGAGSLAVVDARCRVSPLERPQPVPRRRLPQP